MFRKSKILTMTLAGIYFALFSLFACSSGVTSPVQGFIQEVDAVKGTLTVESSSQELIEISYDTATGVRINNEPVDARCLEPGLRVYIETEGKEAKLIEINPAEILGTIVRTDNDGLTIQPRDSNQELVLKIRPHSIIRCQEDLALIEKLDPGRIAEVRFNPVTATAFTIKEMPDNFTFKGGAVGGDRTEGTIAEFKDGELTVDTAGGIPTKISVRDDTEIILSGGLAGTTGDLKPGAKVKAVFNPLNNHAYEIELQ